WAVYRCGWEAVGAALPPGVVFGAAAEPVGVAATVGATLAACLTLATARRSLRHADAELRRWYDRHAGAKVLRWGGRRQRGQVQVQPFMVTGTPTGWATCTGCPAT